MNEAVDEDDVFLSMVEAAEAAASGGRFKRQKFISSSGDSDAGVPDAKEGSYMAALRGSHSIVWNKQLTERQKNSGVPRSGNNPSMNPASYTGGGACFKCGLEGHWARDCDSGRGVELRGGSDSASKEYGEVPEKACPCGSGTCLIRTSNTAKNPGRKFYKCPLHPDNGGCSFFEWCDQPSPHPSASQNVFNSRSSPYTVNETTRNSSTQLSSERSSSTCFMCGQEGHWSRDCPNRSEPSNTFSDTAGKCSSTASNSCFKCGQGGHWSRDCPKQLSSFSIDASVSTTRKSFGSTDSNTCFKCGKSGHWARECPAEKPSAASAIHKKVNF
ncbi:DNA-binding protein HEXBP-like [Zingiber officinale]|uniref:Uncharacterized protein n=1 Tax=Zingiber officinale TaxID=94328 RepID=A0A8J5KSZ0_ZINOF|nr:DNA-binding protein HEXBP-like [Zingiber officinale]KAG6490742.1 hypothetical protein ZIOFF_052052 [Zingiber officinale]